MPEDAEGETPLPAARRSRKLPRAGIILAVLPLILPFPLWQLQLQWIAPISSAAWQQCRSFYCPDVLYWEGLGWLLVLGHRSSSLSYPCSLALLDSSVRAGAQPRREIGRCSAQA